MSRGSCAYFGGGPKLECYGTGSVYGPFKSYLGSAQAAWLRNHPCQRMTYMELYIPGIVNIALPKANTPTNIMNGFKKCGISPYNKDIFENHEFAPAEPTNQPDDITNQPVEITNQHDESNNLPNESTNQHDSVQISVMSQSIGVADDPPASNESSISEVQGNLLATRSDQKAVTTPSTSRSCRKRPAMPFSPEIVRAFPKAPVKTCKRNEGRKRLNTAILTDTPEKETIEDRTARKPQKKSKIQPQQKVKKSSAAAATADGRVWLCNQCGENYNNSVSKEAWVKCIVIDCNEWAHEPCTDGVFICTQCHKIVDGWYKSCH